MKKLKRSKILIITDKILENFFGDQLIKLFKKKEYLFFTDVQPEPSDISVLKAKDFAFKFKPDLIIGLGGGSVMDTAKMIYFLYESEKDSIYECNPITQYDLGKKSRLILIPTTSGTGAEHTPAAVITNSNTGQKVPIATPEIIPHTVILDPKLTLTMPQKLIASTGLDALVHAIEGFTSKIRSDFSDAVNLYAIRLIINYLPDILDTTSNIRLREKLHNAASLAGIGMANSSCGLAHAFGHALGTVHSIQHGIAVGIMLPYIIEYNRNECQNEYLEIIKSIYTTKNENPGILLATSIRDLLKKINFPTSLNQVITNEINWNEKLLQVVDFAQKDILTTFSPRMNKDDFKKIFEYAYIGKSIDF